MYPGYYPPYPPPPPSSGYHNALPPPAPQHPQHAHHQPGVGPLAHLISSPDSHGSDHAPTPNSDHRGGPSRSVSAGGGKRPASGSHTAADAARKRARHEDDVDEDEDSVPEQAGTQKTKTTRGARACTVCRRLKMKCEGAESGPPCKRCSTGNHECIFEESNRGKRSNKKQEVLARSLRKMERTLDTVLRSIGNPALADGLSSRSPSPSGEPSMIKNLHSPALSTSASQSNYPSRPHAQYSPSNQSTHSHGPSLTHRDSGRTPADEGPPSPKLHSLPDNTLNPLGLLAETSLAHRRSQAAHSPDDVLPGTASGEQRVGVASDLYFKPGPMTILPLRRLYIERQIQPEMLSFVDTEEVVALFNIFFEKLNPQAHMLDPSFHTPSLVCSRSPFLLTAICAIASKYHSGRPELHARLTDLSRKLAFEVPAMGYKSVEIVQAYFLLTLWGCGPVERFEHDRTWLLLGMGIRMATDLNLHRRTTSSAQETVDAKTRAREVRNRERTWLIAFCLDRSLSAQMGKPYTIQEDAIIQSAPDWWSHPDAIRGDEGLAAYVELQRINGRCLDLLAPAKGADSVPTNMDYLIVIKAFEAQITAWLHEWTVTKTGGNGPATPFVGYQGRFYFNYAMLVVNSFGLQNALERAPANIGHFFARCHTSATACATIVTRDLGPSGYLKYTTDSHFVQCSYAVLSLLKLIRPEFQSFPEHESKTLAIVQDVADLLEDIATGPLHTPALYSTFLRALIAAKLNPPAPTLSSPSMPRAPPADGDSGDLLPPHAGVNNNGMGGMGMGEPPDAGGVDGGAVMNGFALPPGGYAFSGEMGPVADMSTFPPTMAPHPAGQDMLSMDSILAAGFWDNVLVPGYSNPMEGLSGGFVYGPGGSGLITPRLGMSPLPSGASTPALRALGRSGGPDMDSPQLDGHHLNGGFGLVQRAVEGV